MKLLLLYILFTFLLLSCGKSTLSNHGEVTGIRSTTYNEPTPYGMVLIKRGSFRMGTEDIHPLWGVPNGTKSISLDAFWMDKTEVTNAKYRQFVYWVRDSIIRERLADPIYTGDELFKITEDKYGDPIPPKLNWKISIPWKHPTEEEEIAIESIYYIHPVTKEKQLDRNQINYRYEWFDYQSAVQKKYKTILEDKVNEEIIMISKDTAYTDKNGKIINERISRPLSSPYDFLHTHLINIYPDESCWVNDFDHTNNETYMRMYFNHPAYDNHPVVGVSWEMAKAYCHWRTKLFRSSKALPSGQPMEMFRLPTEAEWEYAARAGRSENIYPWKGMEIQTKKGCFLGNFKPEEGNYTADGHIITAKVGSYTPNEFGLYDMAGNVAEWTSTTYIESNLEQMGDLNPEIRGNIEEDLPYKKRKVIRGGSWKDIPEFIRSDRRSFEYPKQTRSYIGFRCVRTYVGVPTNPKRK